MIGIFNRSHYEDVLIARVRGLAPAADIRRRYDQINAFERHLVDNGVVILKFFLYISRAEQKERLQSRLDRPDKHWKFNRGDLDERKVWDDYMDAYATALRRCSTRHAPWYVIPANRKWARDVAVARIVARALAKMKLRFPEPEPGLEDITIPD
jgi:polyphosphate kinase 2 (PPK2 family)